MNTDEHIENFLYSSAGRLLYAATDTFERKFVYWVRYAKAVCESPIEALFLLAWIELLETLRITGADLFGAPATYYLFNNPMFFASRYNYDELNDDQNDFTKLFEFDLSFEQIDFVYPQQTIGDYRVDFVLFRIRSDYDHDDRPIPRRFSPVVVECDGHEFHEKTKRQAQRDKARDRYLQSHGYKVLRFTGSEIWTDPRKCALEVDKLFRREDNPRTDGRSPAEALNKVMFPTIAETIAQHKEPSDNRTCPF